MSKRKNQNFEMDDDFFAQLDFLRSDYDNALETMEQQKRDVRKLVAILVENDIPIPDDIIDKYIRRCSSSTTEELPFD